MNTKEAVQLAIFAAMEEVDIEIDKDLALVQVMKLREKLKKWSERPHDGDCTNQCHMCFKCLSTIVKQRADALMKALETLNK